MGIGNHELVGPYTRSRVGNKYIIVLHDYFSKWIECMVLRAANAKNVGVTLGYLILSR